MARGKSNIVSTCRYKLIHTPHSSPRENRCPPHSPFHRYVYISPPSGCNLLARGPSVHTSKILLTIYEMARMHLDSDTSLPTLLYSSQGRFPFHNHTLSDINIHSLVASYPCMSMRHTRRSCSHSMLHMQGAPKLATPSFLAEALSCPASIFTLFGGQDLNEIYFNEL